MYNIFTLHNPHAPAHRKVILFTDINSLICQTKLSSETNLPSSFSDSQPLLSDLLATVPLKPDNIRVCAAASCDHVGHIRPTPLNYPAHWNWTPRRNSAMTALSPRRNKHGVLTHQVSLRSHFFTLDSDTHLLSSTYRYQRVPTGVGVFRVNTAWEKLLSPSVDSPDFGWFEVSHKFLFFSYGAGRDIRAP